jgi:hypothetical protein
VVRRREGGVLRESHAIDDLVYVRDWETHEPTVEEVKGLPGQSG